MATIEIDGKTLEVENGKMIIEVADDAGIYIPRFCYHKKLSVAANCRMCLVEVEKNRKTVPACATPITDGMRVFTKSPEAIKSQKAVMDFLLINHPLDCPICDQGGECELQDVSMGYGQDHSNYDESKRSVSGSDLGTLIATEMTRCIHCTRCVRFGDEVAGMRELGATGRGEHMEIGTYVQHSMRSEVSGNIIDLCPVGALTSKPFRYSARAWELTQKNSIAIHDCLGSHVHQHILRGQLLRVVPRECESINETWLSDRDRFSYLGVHHPKRALKPSIKRQGHWEEVDWQTALTFAAQKLNHIISQSGPDQVAAFASPSASTEACYLLQKWMRSLGVNNLDYRVQQSDFRDQLCQSSRLVNTLTYAELEHQKTILLVGCNLNREVPLAAIRARKAVSNGANIFLMSPTDFSCSYDIKDRWILSSQEIILQLATLLVAIVDDINILPSEVKKIVLGLAPDVRLKAVAEQLKQPGAVIVTGAYLENHLDAAVYRTLIGLLAQYSSANLLHFSVGSNAAGAALAGMLPHRSAGGKECDNIGMHVTDALNKSLKAYVLMGVEPSYDFANAAKARESMLAAECVIALSHYADDSVREYADVILPVASFAETSGTYINLDGTWQTIQGVIPPVGEARPAWKVIRVLANICYAPGFEYVSTEDILAEIRDLQLGIMPDLFHDYYYPESLPMVSSNIQRIGEWPLYRVDSVVRHAEALQLSASAEKAFVRIHPETAHKLQLVDKVTVSQGEFEVILPLELDERVAHDVAWIPCALPETIDLGLAFGPITVK